MKKYLISLLTIMMVAMVGFSFVSCSDDDDTGIVGTWRWDDDESDYYDIITFRKDGSGTWTEYYNGKSDREDFSYKYDQKNKILIMYAGDEEETSTVYVNGDIMNWDGDTYQRVK